MNSRCKQNPKRRISVYFKFLSYSIVTPPIQAILIKTIYSNNRDMTDPNQDGRNGKTDRRTVRILDP